MGGEWGSSCSSFTVGHTCFLCFSKQTVVTRRGRISVDRVLYFLTLPEVTLSSSFAAIHISPRCPSQPADLLDRTLCYYKRQLTHKLIEIQMMLCEFGKIFTQMNLTKTSVLAAQTITAKALKRKPVPFGSVINNCILVWPNHQTSKMVAPCSRLCSKKKSC